jgi:hypothetical protein
MVPDDPWVRENSPLSPEKLHALGVITVTWNACQYHLFTILHVVLGGHESEARASSHDMGDISIIEKAAELARAKKLDAQLVELIEDAKRLFDCNLANRNLLTHFRLVAAEDGLRLARNKGPQCLATL